MRRRMGDFFLEKAGDFPAGKASDKVIVHFERLGRKIGRTEEDGLAVED